MQIRTESDGVVLTLYREDLADADVHGLMERVLIQLAERPGFVILNVDVDTITEVGIAALARMRWVLHGRELECFTLAPAGVMDLLKLCRMAEFLGGKPEMTVSDIVPFRQARRGEDPGRGSTLRERRPCWPWPSSWLTWSFT